MRSNRLHDEEWNRIKILLLGILGMWMCPARIYINLNPGFRLF